MINRVQKLRKHAGLVATEPVEVWLAERCLEASHGAAGAARTSSAVSHDGGAGASEAAAAPAGAHAATEERAEANGLATDMEAVAVPLSSLLDSQVCSLMPCIAVALLITLDVGNANAWLACACQEWKAMAGCHPPVLWL